MLRVPLSDLSSGERALPREQDRYVTRVHRLALGDRFLAFDPAARLEAEVEIVALAPARVVVGPPRAAELVATRSVTVVQCLAKGAKLDAVVRDATELGATRIVFAEAERSVPKADADKLARWRRIALEAARQCGRGDVPELLGPLSLVEALATHREGLGLVLHPGADSKLGAALRKLEAGDAVTVVIGPEGGFAGDELAEATSAGYACASLGPFVVRTETACAAALGAIAVWASTR